VAFIAGDDFDFLTQLEGGTAITSYYLKEHAEAGKAALTTAAQALSCSMIALGPILTPPWQ